MLTTTKHNAHRFISIPMATCYHRCLILTIASLTLCAPLSVAVAIPTPLADIALSPSLFDGTRRDAVAWSQPQPMSVWSIVAVVRPTPASATGYSKTVVTNDTAGWNDDVLFGICPETSNVSDAGKWAIIHQDSTDEKRTIVVVEQSIVVDTWYHIAATSDGEHLRFYINGQPATCPIQKEGAGLNFGNATTYIGGSVNGGGRYFEGDISSVKLYDTTLTDEDIAALAMTEGLLDQADPSLECYVDNIIIEGEQVRLVTSIDFLNGYEIITDLDNDRFVYRLLGTIGWQVAAALSPTPLDRQHSITWSDSVTPARYFVADTDNNRIVSFELLTSGTIHSETPLISGTLLTRPHDLEFNAADGYFYGVTAPLASQSNSLPKVLFRFRDIGVDEGVLEIAAPGTDNSKFYMRSLSIIEDIVYVVNSRGFDPEGPQVIRINNFDTGDTTTYTAHSSFEADLQSIEYHNGWWYGTGNTNGPFLARWSTWADFENGYWEDLSSLVYAPESGGEITNSTAYFLTCWSGRLFFTVYHNIEGDMQDRVYEIVASDSMGTYVDPIPSGDSVFDLWSYPNPFNPSTILSFYLPHAGPVTLTLYDVSGRRVRSLINLSLPAGPHEVYWRGLDESGRPVASGIYFAQLSLNGQKVLTRKLVLLK